MFDHSIWVLLQTTHLPVLATNVEVFSATCSFFLEVVSSARFALVTQRASGLCVDEIILVVGQTQDCSRFSTYTRCVYLAEPLPFQVFLRDSPATSTPLAHSSRLGSRGWWLFRSESLPLCRVIFHHQVIVQKSCSANWHALNFFEVFPAIVQIVWCKPQVAICSATGIGVQPQETTSCSRRPPLPSR